MATSHAFLIFKVSISSDVGGFRAVLDDTARSFLVKDAVKPGGSGKDELFGFDVGVELRSRTHCGGGGGTLAMTRADVVYAADCRASSHVWGLQNVCAVL
jgi:hypothetical protein